MININEIKNRIEQAFSKYTFHDEEHNYTYYTNNGEIKKIGISTTQLIHSYLQPFDEDKISKLVAKRDGVTQQDVLDQWNYEREFACEYGTLAHLYLECKWKNEVFEYDTKPYIYKFGKDVVTPKFEQIKPALEQFYQTFKDRLEIIGAEVVIASQDYDVAGSIDLLAYSKKLNAIIIIDNKSNKEIKKESYRDTKMLTPLSHIPDSNYWHYSLQGAIYKRILEKETGLKISERKFLIWFDYENKKFQIIECANLDEEAKIILEKRKENKE